VDSGVASIGLILCSWSKGTTDCARLQPLGREDQHRLRQASQSAIYLALQELYHVAVDEGWRDGIENEVWRCLLWLEVVCRCEKALHTDDVEGCALALTMWAMWGGFACIRFQEPAATALHKADYHRHHHNPIVL
jgi:hypothetical protein